LKLNPPLNLRKNTMPLVTLTIQKPKTAEFKTKVLAAIHEALVSVGVPLTDRFQRVLELDQDDFRFDPQYPDTTKPRNSDFVLIEILWSVGRSVKVKKTFLGKAIELLSASGLEPESVMIVFKETAWENWSFAGGRQLHV
jgi:phenylpyruvate tautomerase PptA (4-oxalocrotonate tautomerase family)